MKNFKGTKGKWVFDDVQIFSLNKSEDTPETFIAENPDPYSETRDNKWLPNALLISKAPEMLEMLERMVEIIDRIHPDVKPVALLSLRMNAKKLIKKATEL